MELKDITSKLVEKADAELKERINKAGYALYEMFSYGQSNPLCMYDTERKSVKVYAAAAHQALKDLAFTLNRDGNRQKAIDAFVAEVERLGSEVDDLRASLPQ